MPLDATPGPGPRLLSDADVGFDAAPKLLSDADVGFKEAPATASPTSAGSVDEYGRSAEPLAAPPDAPKAVGRIAEAAAEGWQGGSFQKPEVADRAAAENDQTLVGKYLVNPLVAASNVPFRAMGAVGGGLSQAATEVGAAVGSPELGRDLNMLAQVAPLAHVPGASPVAGIRQALTRDPIAAIGAASDIDGAIAAAGQAAKTPVGDVGAALAPAESPQLRLLQQTEGAILRRVDGDETRLTPAEGVRLDNLRAKMAGMQGPADDIPTVTVTAPAAGATTEAPGAALEPQSAGAAASREGTAPALIDEVTPAQKATALQKMVNQSAEDRLTPQGRDDAVYVEGVQRPESMRDFSPAAEGDMSAALAHKTSYYMDSNYRGQHDALVKENNNIMKDRLDSLFGDANARDAAMEQAKELMPGPSGLFAGERPVNAQPIVDRIREILASPAGKRDAVKSQMNALIPNLTDADGNLETLPSMLKGVRDNITDKLYDKSPTVEGNAARTARNQLRDVLSVVDQTIGDGLPGTRYQDYLANLSTALGQVSKLDFLQRYLTGSKKLTDLSGNLLFNKVQTLLNDIQAHHTDQTGGAKELTMSEINQIEAIRNELAAKDLLDRRSRVPGSPTAQVQNAAGVLGTGPLGTAVRGGAEMALHGGLALTTHGVGNAVLGGYRYFVKPHIDAARAQQAAAELATMKARLLDTTPRPDAAP